MKKKWSALVLCVCMATSGLQVNGAYAMEEWKIQAKDMTELDFHTNCLELSFAMDKDNAYVWSCVTEGLEACTVEPMDMQTDGAGNSVSVFRLCSVCEGTEFIHFSCMDEQRTVKKNLTYKVMVDSEGTMKCIKMAYYSDDVNNSLKNWDQEGSGAIFTFPRDSKGVSSIQIADTDIVSSDNWRNYLWGDYSYNELEEDWLMESTQYVLLQPQKAGSTTMTVVYCKGGPGAEYLEMSYQLVVDENLHITVIPVKYIEPEKDTTEGIITTESMGTTGYMWSYKIADQNIADIIKQDSISYDEYSVGGGWTTYYTVKGLNCGTTYIRFTYARDEKSGFYYVDVCDSVWYRVDVDEQNRVTITEISYTELPEIVDLPQITSSPAIMASCYPSYSMPPEVAEGPAKTFEINSSPVVQSEPPKVTEPPVFAAETPQISKMPVLYTEEPKETGEAAQLPKPTENTIPMDTLKPTVMPETTATTVSTTVIPTATANSENIPAQVEPKDDVVTTKVPDTTKKASITVGTVKITSTLRKTAKKAVVKWKKLAGVNGYQVVIATDKKFSKNVKKKNVSKIQATVSSLRKGKKYYVKVCAYSFNQNGKKVYGNYSAVKVIKKK